MHIISKVKLRKFWAKHPEAESPLNAWHKNVEKADWACSQDVNRTYRKADAVGDEFVVFDICGNKYRLVVRVDYQQSIVYIYDLYTHAEYDKLDLKAIDEKYRREKKQKENDRGKR